MEGSGDASPKFDYMQAVVDGWSKPSFLVPTECNTARFDADWNQAVQRVIVGGKTPKEAMQEAEKTFLSRQKPMASRRGRPLHVTSDSDARQFELVSVPVRGAGAGHRRVFVAVPLGIGVYYSLHEADYFELRASSASTTTSRYSTRRWCARAWFATVIFSVFSLVITLGVGMALALHLERDTRLNVFVRAVVLVPYTIAMLVGSLLLKWIFSQGRRDHVRSCSALRPGGRDHPRRSERRHGRAGLQRRVARQRVRDDPAARRPQGHSARNSMPPRASTAPAPWYRFRRITLPLMRVPILITLMRLLIHFVNVLTFALILTGGGPNNATQTMGLAMYRMGFVDFRLGEANALAMLVLPVQPRADRVHTACSSASGGRRGMSAAAPVPAPRGGDSAQAGGAARCAQSERGRHGRHLHRRAVPDPLGPVDVAQAGERTSSNIRRSSFRPRRRSSTTRCSSSTGIQQVHPEQRHRVGGDGRAAALALGSLAAYATGAVRLPRQARS